MKKAFMRSKSKKIEYPAFTNFTIKVDVKKSWHDTVKMVLKNVEGVTTFRMGDDGTINISGYIDPAQLLKCLKEAGKKAEMVHWQYGECSNNLFENTEPPAKDDGNGEENYHLHSGYNGYGYGNPYGYDYSYPTYARNYAYKHLECSGTAEDCNGHHAVQPKNSDKPNMEEPKNSDNSTCSIPQRITSSGEDLMPGQSATKCCSLM